MVSQILVFGTAAHTHYPTNDYTAYHDWIWLFEKEQEGYYRCYGDYSQVLAKHSSPGPVLKEREKGSHYLFVLSMWSDYDRLCQPKQASRLFLITAWPGLNLVSLSALVSAKLKNMRLLWQEHNISIFNLPKVKILNNFIKVTAGYRTMTQK